MQDSYFDCFQGRQLSQSRAKRLKYALKGREHIFHSLLRHYFVSRQHRVTPEAGAHGEARGALWLCEHRGVEPEREPPPVRVR